MNAVTEAAQEAAFWVFLVAAVLGLLGGLLRLAAKANRIIDTTETSAKLIRYHLGPNGDTPPIHKRIAELERVHDIEPPEGQ